jgi:Flp pilus assembly CpaE family ATPase
VSVTGVLLCLAPQVEDRILPLLVARGIAVTGRPATAAEAAVVLSRVPADLLLVSAETRHLDDALVRAASAHGVAVVALAEPGADPAAIDRLGVPVLSADAPLDELLAAVEQPVAAPAAAPERADHAPSRGAVLAVWGPTGAPGRTTTAITVAAELAATGATVALVDADTVGAAVAPSLGLFDEAPGFAAACRLAGADALTTGELDRVAQSYRGPRGGFAVLTGIGRAARWPELSADRVTRVLEVCREWADHTVVDVGFNLESDEEIVSDLFAPRRNAATLAALRAADRVVAVGAADPVGLARFVRSYGDLVEVADQARIDIVITKVRASAVGLNPSGQIRATLLRFAGIEDVTLVPDDAGGCDAALLSARALPDAAPRSAAVAVLRRLVRDRLAPAPAPEPRRRALFRRTPLPA